jgi:N-methylhydantoinase A
LHLQRFSYSNPHDIVELVTVRLAAVGRLKAIDAEAAPSPTVTGAQRQRRVWLDGGWRQIAVVQRETLAAGQTIAGPAIVEEDYTTVLVGDGWSATCSPQGHLLATRWGAKA